MKTELLVQMDGLAKSPDLVFVLAASNIPWYVTSTYMYMYSVYIYIHAMQLYMYV